MEIRKKFWGGLFHTYDHDCIPRTNNDMERFILIGSDLPLKGLGFSVDPAERKCYLLFPMNRIGDVWGNMRKKRGMIVLEEWQILRETDTIITDNQSNLVFI